MTAVNIEALAEHLYTITSIEHRGSSFSWQEQVHAEAVHGEEFRVLADFRERARSVAEWFEHPIELPRDPRPWQLDGKRYSEAELARGHFYPDHPYWEPRSGYAQHAKDYS